MPLLGVVDLQRCCLHAKRFHTHNVCIATYRWLFLCDVMAVRLLPFQIRRTLTPRLMRHLRRCYGSSIVFLRVPDEEDSRVLSVATDVSRSRE